jgi:hypothetical protein
MPFFFAFEFFPALDETATIAPYALEKGLPAASPGIRIDLGGDRSAQSGAERILVSLLGRPSDALGDDAGDLAGLRG